MYIYLYTYSLCHVREDIHSLLLQSVINHFIHSVIESEETELHVVWENFHSIHIPSELPLIGINEYTVDLSINIYMYMYE